MKNKPYKSLYESRDDESGILEFESYGDFQDYIHDNGLALNDSGPFVIKNKYNNEIVYNTVYDAFVAHES
jgi:hypothetical protein